MEGDLWEGVNSVIDRASSLEDLRAHGLHLLAAWHWRATRQQVPANLVDEEMRAARLRVTAVQVLREIRRLYDGEVMVLKGPHTGGFYPAPHLRPFYDLDILVDEPHRAYACLTAAGFVPLRRADDYYEGLHHLRPLGAPTSPPLMVEIHRYPNWFRWSDPPSAEELLASAERDILGVPGLAGLCPAHHALVVAAHGWTELPLRRLLDLTDVAAVAQAADRDEIERIARRWGIARMWRTTIDAADALFLGGPLPSSLRIWGRNLPAARDRTVIETHVRRTLSAFWALPPPQALVATAGSLLHVVLPAPDDSWQTKLSRARRAVANWSTPTSQHTRDFDESSWRAPRFRRR